jgi:hypothetical protein
MRAGTDLNACLIYLGQPRTPMPIAREWIRSNLSAKTCAPEVSTTDGRFADRVKGTYPFRIHVVDKELAVRWNPSSNLSLMAMTSPTARTHIAGCMGLRSNPNTWAWGFSSATSIAHEPVPVPTSKTSCNLPFSIGARNNFPSNA